MRVTSSSVKGRLGQSFTVLERPKRHSNGVVTPLMTKKPQLPGGDETAGNFVGKRCDNIFSVTLESEKHRCNISFMNLNVCLGFLVLFCEWSRGNMIHQC